MTLAAVAGRAGPLFGVAADAEFMSRLLVNAECTRSPFMTVFAGVETHML